MLPDTPQLLIFIAATLALIVIPGPAVFYIIARSMDYGRTAGLISAIGMSVGTMVHILTAALGLSAILLTSSLAFNVVKYLGAFYLIYLGIRKLMEKPNQQTVILAAEQSKGKIFYQAVLVNILNPKTALFFFTFLPQFVDEDKGNISLQIVLLGCILMGIGLISDSVYAWLAGGLGSWLKENTWYLKTQKYTSAVVYFALGIFAAMTGSQTKEG